MIATMNTSATTLEWRAIAALDPRFELGDGDEVKASLAFDSPATTRARAETREGTWTFERPGLLSATVHVREVGSDQDLALFHPGLLGPGHLRFGNGVAFSWHHHGLGSGTWSFRGEGGETLVILRRTEYPGRGPQAPEALVEIPPAGRFLPRVPLLATLGWYLILLHQWDGAAEEPGGLQGL